MYLFLTCGTPFLLHGFSANINLQKFNLEDGPFGSNLTTPQEMQLTDSKPHR